MNAYFRVNGIYTEEETGDVYAKCHDIIYEEDFEKFLGQPDEFDGKENASSILKDSTYEMSDKVRLKIQDTFGIEEFDDEQNYGGYQFYDFGDDDFEDEPTDDELDAMALSMSRRESFNLREELNKIDIHTDNKYDLLNLYEACNLSENEKRALANIVYDQEDAQVIYDTLNDRFVKGEEIGMPERVKDGVIHEDIYSNDEESTMTLVANDVVKFPNVISFKATFDDGELKGHTWSFVKADANGEEFIRSIGGDPDDTPVAFLTVNGKDGGYFTSTKDFAHGEYKSIKEDADNWSFDKAVDWLTDVAMDKYLYSTNTESAYWSAVGLALDNETLPAVLKTPGVRKKIMQIAPQIVASKYGDKLHKNESKSIRESSTDDLHKRALNAYNQDDDNFFCDLSDDELVTLWRNCMITDTNSFGAPYDDEVYDAISDRPNSKELFDRASSGSNVKGSNVSNIPSDMVIVTMAPQWHKAFSKFLKDNGVNALVSMESDKVDYTIKLEDEMRIRGLWNPADYRRYVNESLDDFDDEFNAYYDGYTSELSASEKRLLALGIERDNWGDLLVDNEETRKEYGLVRNKAKEIAQEKGMTLSAFVDTLNESVDEEEPYTKEQIEHDLKVLTKNFTEKEGELKCGFEEEKRFGVEILKKHYKVVEASGDDRRNGTWYHISFAEPIEK